MTTFTWQSQSITHVAICLDIQNTVGCIFFYEIKISLELLPQRKDS